MAMINLFERSALQYDEEEAYHMGGRFPLPPVFEHSTGFPRTQRALSLLSPPQIAELEGALSVRRPHVAHLQLHKLIRSCRANLTQ